MQAVLGAACISSSAILVTLANVGPATTAFYRFALPLPVLAALAVAERRRHGPRPLASHAYAALAGLFWAINLVLGAVLTGLIPAATARLAVLRAGERPRLAYWAALAIGLAVVIGFALIQGAGRLRSGDVILLAAIGVAGLGYAEGGALARTYGGWRVICRAVILALPVTAPVTIAAAVTDPPRHLTAGAVIGLA